MYRGTTEPNFASLNQALKSGNAASIVAFNGGTAEPFTPLTEWQDYTAGEVAGEFPVPYQWRPMSRFINGCQLHVLSFLGQSWGLGPPRFSWAFVAGYTQELNHLGGVMTWDVAISGKGAIDRPLFDQLKRIGASH